jgi:hypothetical protein
VSDFGQGIRFLNGCYSNDLENRTYRIIPAVSTTHAKKSERETVSVNDRSAYNPSQRVFSDVVTSLLN